MKGSVIIYPLKAVLNKDELYTIKKCRIVKKRFSYNMLIDVVAASGGETIETYFGDLVTKRLLKFCDNTGENCEELLPGVQFTYGGEVTSMGGTCPIIPIC